LWEWVCHLLLWIAIQAHFLFKLDPRCARWGVDCLNTIPASWDWSLNLSAWGWASPRIPSLPCKTNFLFSWEALPTKAAFHLLAAKPLQKGDSFQWDALIPRLRSKCLLGILRVYPSLAFCQWKSTPMLPRHSQFTIRPISLLPRRFHNLWLVIWRHFNWRCAAHRIFFIFAGSHWVFCTRMILHSSDCGCLLLRSFGKLFFWKTAIFYQQLLWTLQILTPWCSRGWECSSCEKVDSFRFVLLFGPRYALEGNNAFVKQKWGKARDAWE
jgi:hypothetical protein